MLGFTARRQPNGYLKAPPLPAGLFFVLATAYHRIREAVTLGPLPVAVLVWNGERLVCRPRNGPNLPAPLPRAASSRGPEYPSTPKCVLGDPRHPHK